MTVTEYLFRLENADLYSLEHVIGEVVRIGKNYFLITEIKKNKWKRTLHYYGHEVTRSDNGIHNEDRCGQILVKNYSEHIYHCCQLKKGHYGKCQCPCLYEWII